MDEQEMKEAQQRFWHNLKDLCKSHEISLRKLTADIGIATSPVTKWKNGAWPDTKTLKLISDYFNITIDELLGNYDVRTGDLLLSQTEKKLVLAYRKMTDADRQVINIIASKYEG